MPRVVSLKLQQLKQRGYNNVAEWLSNSKDLYVERRMRMFIHKR